MLTALEALRAQPCAAYRTTAFALSETNELLSEINELLSEMNDGLAG